MTATHIADQYGTRRIQRKGCDHYWHLTAQTTEGCAECRTCGGEELLWRVWSALLKEVQDDPGRRAKLKEALR